MINAIIKVKNVSKTINDKQILKNISFNVESGQCIALIGPNGAGKTTLFNCLLGYKFTTSGSITIYDKDVNDEQLKLIVRVLPQENVIPKKLKVSELINFTKSIYPNHLTDEEIDSFLQFSNEQKNQLAEKLSGGQRRLLNFVLTLISKPKIIFLDEPTTAMDTATRINFWRIIDKLKKAATTIIYSSHYIEEVESTADRILVIKDGALIRNTTPHALRSEKIEKIFTVPIKYLNTVKTLENINHLTVKQDNVQFTTSDGLSCWQILQQSGLTFDELEVQNQSLLNIIFKTTEEDE